MFSCSGTLPWSPIWLDFIQEICSFLLSRNSFMVPYLAQFLSGSCVCSISFCPIFIQEVQCSGLQFFAGPWGEFPEIGGHRAWEGPHNRRTSTEAFLCFGFQLDPGKERALITWRWPTDPGSFSFSPTQSTVAFNAVPIDVIKCRSIMEELWI